MKLPIVTTLAADAQIHTIDGWWRQDRTASPDSFLDELSQVFELIAQTPLLGVRTDDRRWLGSFSARPATTSTSPSGNMT